MTNLTSAASALASDFFSASSAAAASSAGRIVRLWRFAPHAEPIFSRWQNRHSSPVVYSGTGLPTWSLPHAAGSSRFGSSEAPRRACAAKSASTQRALPTPAAVRPLRIGTHPTVGGVVAHAAALQVGRLQLAQRVRGQRVALGLHVDAVDLGRVEAEDLRLVVLRELLVPELLAQLVCDLEPLHQVDHPLWRAPPQTVRAPEHVIDPVVLD